jgi:hypothetical protein
MEIKTTSSPYDEKESGKKLLIDYTQRGKMVSRPFNWKGDVKKQGLETTKLKIGESTSIPFAAYQNCERDIEESFRTSLEPLKVIHSSSLGTSSKTLNSSELSGDDKEKKGVVEHDMIEFFLKLPSKESRSKRIEISETFRHRQSASMRKKKTKSVIQSVLEQVS